MRLRKLAGQNFRRFSKRNAKRVGSIPFQISSMKEFSTTRFRSWPGHLNWGQVRVVWRHWVDVGRIWGQVRTTTTSVNTITVNNNAHCVYWSCLHKQISSTSSSTLNHISVVSGKEFTPVDLTMNDVMLQARDSLEDDDWRICIGDQ